MKQLYYIFFASLVIHMALMTIGVSNYINEAHGFRQAQTAISTYYIDLSKIDVNYKTPVLGAPWTIPFEFPIYQYVVAILHNLTNLELGLTGRIVSIICFYLCLMTVMRFGTIIPRFPSILVGTLMLSSSIYIFWSRTFLIESMALFFSLQFFYYMALYVKRTNILYLFLGFIFGILAILLKVTTFAVSLFALVFFCLIEIYNNYNNLKDYLGRFIFSLLVVIFCLCCQFIWTKHSDFLKEQSYMGAMLTSSELASWNFGTLNQRLNPISWLKITRNSSFNFMICFLLSVLILFKKNADSQSKISFIFFISVGFSGPLVFFNLYVIHDYYHYANTIFLLCGLAWYIEHLITNPKVKTIFLIGVLLLGYSFYSWKYLPKQLFEDKELPEFAKLIKSKTKIEDVLLVLGQDWSSEIPYFSERKAICFSEKFRNELETNPLVFLKNLNTPNINCIIVSSQYLSEMDKNYMKCIFNEIGIRHKYVSQNKSFVLLVK